MRIGLGEPSWLPITYEQLPLFYYCCGKLGHTHKDCAKVDENEEQLTEDLLPYGNFIRASPLRSVSVMEENNKGQIEHLRRSLFSKYPVKTGNHKESKSNDGNPHIEVGVTDLLNSLEKVQVRGGEPTEDMKQVQITKEKKQTHEAQQVNDIKSRFLKTNILHPTTKTLTPTPIHNTIPTKKPPENTINHPGSQKPIPKVSIPESSKENLNHSPILIPKPSLLW